MRLWSVTLQFILRPTLIAPLLLFLQKNGTFLNSPFPISSLLWLYFTSFFIYFCFIIFCPCSMCDVRNFKRQSCHANRSSSPMSSRLFSDSEWMEEWLFRTVSGIKNSNYFLNCIHISVFHSYVLSFFPSHYSWHPSIAIDRYRNEIIQILSYLFPVDWMASEN